WKELGGRDKKITPYSFDEILESYTEEELGEDLEHVPALFNEQIKQDEGIVVFALQYFYNPYGPGKKLYVDDISTIDLFFGKQWYPTTKPAAQLGFWPLILGTLLVSIVAILFALPFALAASIYLAELASKRVRSFMKPTIELLAGIPSVVYGFFGLAVIVPFVKDLFDIPVGETALAGAIVLAIMALPTIITIAEDSLRTTPRAMREASLALGANKWQTILKVSIPYSISGITAAIILGVGRAIGETMAILMVSGNAAVIPNSLLKPVRTIPATIAAELGEAPFGGLHFKSLFALGCILFVITMAVNFLVEVMSPKRRVN
ncbi:MAG: phosphate ABC transporter permease subunit PstC, partial [Bacteroidia bacterium]|nr:phosphate ABC transporter permease subunit PstC [Bacteroidia bacterium]